MALGTSNSLSILIRDLTRRQWIVIYQQTYREGNYGADTMANLTIRNSYERCTWNTPPDFMCEFLLPDESGASLPRRMTMNFFFFWMPVSVSLVGLGPLMCRKKKKVAFDLFLKIKINWGNMKRQQIA